MDQTAVAPSRPAASHHLDHPELLLLDNAVVRVAEQYIAKHTLTATQRDALSEYRADLDELILTLAGPARDYAEQVVVLADTVLSAETAVRAGDSKADGGAHRAA